LGATFDLASFSDTVGSLAGAGSVTTNVAGPVTPSCGGLGTSTIFSGAIMAGSGTLTLTKTGAGALTLSGANTYTGGTSVSVGVVRVQSNGALGASGTGTTIASGAELDIDGNGLAIAEPITSLSGTGIAAA